MDTIMNDPEFIKAVEDGTDKLQLIWEKANSQTNR